MSGQQHAPAALYHRERPGTHCTGGWVGPTAGLEGRKISPPTTGIRFPDRPAPSQSLYRLSYPTHFSFPVAVNNSVKVGPFGFLVVNVCNQGERYETPCIFEAGGE